MVCSKKQSIIVLIFFITLLCLTGCGNPKEPKLVLSEEEWYYGEVKPDEIAAHQFTLKNEGEADLKIESIYSSCACVSLELAEKTIPAGGKTMLGTIFDPYGYEGYVSKNFTIKSNDPKAPEKKIELSITVLRVPHPVIELSQQTFDLGTINCKEQAISQFCITNTGDADLIIEDIVAEELFSHNLLLPLTIPSEGQQLAEVYLDVSRLKEGDFRKAVRIMTNDPQNNMLFLRITGTIDNSSTQ
ncbi:MAG: DUF1573 domain-containing protein [Candidatus Atribacteria bacterium]|nr:DUF1573 domain-containing protein [Candidatus Atribacteria bacterium]